MNDVRAMTVRSDMSVDRYRREQCFFVSRYCRVKKNSTQCTFISDSDIG